MVKSNSAVSALPDIKVKIYAAAFYFLVALYITSFVYLFGAKVGIVPENLISLVGEGLHSYLINNMMAVGHAIAVWGLIILLIIKAMSLKEVSTLSIDFIIENSQLSDGELASFLKRKKDTRSLRYKLVEYIYLKRKIKEENPVQLKSSIEDEVVREQRLFESMKAPSEDQLPSDVSFSAKEDDLNDALNVLNLASLDDEDRAVQGSQSTGPSSELLAESENILEDPESKDSLKPLV